MNLTAEDLHHRLDQLRLLASETDDPLAGRLVRDLIVELEDMLRATARPRAKKSRQRGQSAASALPAARVSSSIGPQPGASGSAAALSVRGKRQQI
jgi:hypothetical protein